MTDRDTQHAYKDVTSGQHRRCREGNLLLKVYRLLPAKRKFQLWLIFGGMCILAVVELATVAILAVFASALAEPSSVTSATKFGWLVSFFGDSLFENHTSLILTLSIAAAILVVIKNGMAAVLAYFNGLYSALIDSYFGNILLFGFLHRDYEWHLSRNTADLVTVLDWRKQIGSIITYMSIQTASDVLIVSFLLVGLVFAAPLVSLTVIVVLGTAAFFIYNVLRPHLDKVSTDASELALSINRYVTRAIHGIRDVKVFGREEPFMLDYQTDARRYAFREAEQRLLMRSSTWILEAIAFLMLAAVVFIMLSQLDASSGRISGTIALLAVTAWRVLPATNRILNGVTTIRASLPQAKKAFLYIDEFIERYGQSGYPRETRNIEFGDQLVVRGLTFKYENSPSANIRNVDLEVNRGECIGIIGESGAGKSTLTDLIIGLLKPQQGKILLDGVELGSEDIRGWMQKIGYVSQNPYIFDGTLAENIAFGVPGSAIDRDKVRKCCTLASIDEFIDELAAGIDTRIGERGTKLSGGQRQRVAIARALYRDPDILVLDEATSALDSRNEHAIRNTLRRLHGNQTMIIIAHRLSTVKYCDKILWLENGSVRKVGPPGIVLPQYEAGHPV